MTSQLWFSISLSPVIIESKLSRSDKLNNYLDKYSVIKLPEKLLNWFQSQRFILGNLKKESNYRKNIFRGKRKTFA